MSYLHKDIQLLEKVEQGVPKITCSWIDFTCNDNLRNRKNEWGSY